MERTPPGLVLAPSATVGRDVTFGAHVVVHDGQARLGRRRESYDDLLSAEVL